MGNSSKKRRQLKLAHRAHPLSHIIRSITSKTKHRLLREHYPRSQTENLLSSGGFTFSGSGARFQQYGKLNHKASGWNEERINRLLEPRVSNEEINLPDESKPRLDSDYIDKHLLCLPEELRRNIRRQGVKKRQRRIESYFVNTYGYIPPRVRRLISGSYRLSEKGLPALRRTAKSDARRRYKQHLSESSSSTSPSSSISTPPRRQRHTDNSNSSPPSTSHLSPLGFNLSPISPSIHDIIQQVQGTQPLPQGSPFQIVNRQYDRSRSPSVEITGDQAGQTPPPPTPPTPPGEKEYEEYDENSPPYSTRSSSNFMGFSPLQGQNGTPHPPSTTPGQVAMNLVEDSAKDLETVLNVAETGVKSLLSRIRAGEKVVATAEAPSVPPATTNDDDNIDAILHDILEEEFKHPPINPSIGEHRQYLMETENMYNELLDHNNAPLLPSTPPPSRKKPMARIAHKPPMPIAPVPRIAHKPPMPIASPSRHRIAHKPPMPIASPRPTRIAHKSPSRRNTKIKNAGTQVGNDRGVHNTLNDIFRDFCEGRKNTKQATHKILDIVHQISKDNIR